MRSVHQLFLCAALVATTSTALAQERGPRGFGSPSGAMLLGQKSVQEDLKLSEEQLKQVTEFSAKQREGFSGLRDASREERAKRFNESREAGQKAVDTILNEEQRARLKQITLQLAGPAAFADPAVTEKLALTDEQKKSVEEIQSGHREEARSLMQGDGDRAEAFRKLQAARQSTEDKLKALLTDEQKAKLEELTGKKFEGRLEGPGGRGPGGRGQGGPGRGQGGPGRARERRGGEDASIRRDEPLGERDTVLTADKSDDSEKPKAKKPSGDKKKAHHQRGGSTKSHAKHARHRKHGEHAARHHGRGPHARHASHKRAGERGDRKQGQCEYGVAHRGPHRHHPHARYAHARHRHHGGEHGNRHFAHRGFNHRGPHQRHPGFHAPHGSDARRQAWHRVALAMGANHRFHGPQHFARHHSAQRGHASHRHHWAHRGHDAHRGHGHHRHHDVRRHLADGWRGAGQHFRVAPHQRGPRHDERAHHGPHRGPERAFHHYFAGRPHGQGFGHGEHRVGGFGGPERPNFAWHFDRHREDGPGFDREHGPRGHHPRLHPAGFKKRPHDAGEHREKDGKHEKKAGKGDRKHGQRDSEKAHKKHKDGGKKAAEKAPEKNDG